MSTDVRLSLRTLTGKFENKDQVALPSNHSIPETNQLASKLVHLALPVRWSVLGQEGRGAIDYGCTYDIHPHGARLLGTRPVTVGDMVMVERGRNKAVCQVVWTADPSSLLRGQFSVRCVEKKTPWDDELRQMEEQYQPLILEEPARRSSAHSFVQTEVNRRRRPRFYVDGQAEIVDGVQRTAGEIQQISEYGARLAAIDQMRPGSDFRLMLNIFDVTLALKAQVKYLVGTLAMGVEFHEIRRGDRPLLSYILSRLRTHRVEEFVPVEVVLDHLATAAG